MKTTFEALPLKAVFEYEGIPFMLVKVSDTEYYHPVAGSVYPRIKRQGTVIHHADMNANDVVVTRRNNLRSYSDMDVGSYFTIANLNYKFKKVDQMRALCMDNFDLCPFDGSDMVKPIDCEQHLNEHSAQ